MTEPVASYGDVSWWGNFGEYGFLTKLRTEQLRDIGPSLSAQSAFLLLQGVETLPQRMRRPPGQRPQGGRVAGGRRAGRVGAATPACPAHPHHERGRQYLPAGLGSVFSFGVKGGRAAGPEVHRVGAAVQPPGQHRRRPHAGDPPGIDHAPAAHRRPAGGRRRAARTWSASRVGIEDVDDILWDLDQALPHRRRPRSASEPRTARRHGFDAAEFASPSTTASCAAPLPATSRAPVATGETVETGAAK